MQLTGLDAGEAGLAIARGRVPDATFKVADAREVGYDAAFDIACAFDVLEHIDDDATVVEQLRRACRPGGGLLVTVPQHRWMWSAADQSAGHIRRYERRELIALVQRSGFHIRRVTSFVSFLLPAVAVARVVHRSKTEYDCEGALRPRLMLDGVAAAAFAVERRLIASGLSFPWGLSLLLVAQRK